MVGKHASISGVMSEGYTASHDAHQAATGRFLPLPVDTFSPRLFTISLQNRPVSDMPALAACGRPPQITLTPRRTRRR
jgi:hypothetical protein